jgi:hypothetical protein
MGLSPFVSSGESMVIVVDEVSGKHLSFMEYSRHDDSVRIIDIESD